MKPNFAIIGCGRIAKRHAEQINKVGKLVAVCDIILENATEFARDYEARQYATIEELLENEPSVDVVSICTPNGLHAQHSILALSAKKHVLCEKPLCISVADAREMIKTANRVDKKLFVVKQNRYNPPVQIVKQLLDEDKLGTIFSF
ncbi:MAG: Gfo/Idh/MocA family oxidoreductase, partial [Ferruginibacter sp.]